MHQQTYNNQNFLIRNTYTFTKTLMIHKLIVDAFTKSTTVAQEPELLI